MRRATWMISLIAIGLVVGLVGCDRSPDGQKAMSFKPRPEDQKPNDKVENTRPAAVQEAPSQSNLYLIRDNEREGRWVYFPPAKIHIKEQDGRVLAFLSSKDPPEVLSEGYHGNRYYFELKLEKLEDAGDGVFAGGYYKAPSAELADDPNGIFLDGDRQHLQPYEIDVMLRRDGDHVICEISGQFMEFSKNVRKGIPVIVPREGGKLRARADGK